MASVPYKAAPSNEPAATPPPDYFHLDVSANTFGGHIAKGLEQLGQGVSQAADMWGQLQTDAQINKALKEGNQAVDQLRSLHGQDQIDYANGLPEHLDQIITNYGSQLSPVQRNRYENAVRPYQQRLWNGEITTSSDRATQEVAKTINGDTLKDALNRAANSPEDSDDFKHAVADAVYARQQDVRAAGNENVPGTMKTAAETGRMQAYQQRAEALAVHDPVGAADFTDKHRTELGAAYAPLAEKFRAKALQIRGDNVGKAAMDAAMTGAPVDDVKKAVGAENFEGGGAPSAQQPGGNVLPFQPKGAAPAQPTPSAARLGGDGARVEVPFKSVASSLFTPDGHADLINNAMKQYQPGTTFSIQLPVPYQGKSNFEFTIPKAGTTFQFEGKSYTVPGAAPADATAQKMNFAPEGGGQEPAQQAINSALKVNYTPPPESRADARQAAVRTNNPGAQWPNKIAEAYGATGHENLADGNKIATFPTPINGAAANMALLADRYKGMTVGAIQSRWSGQHRSSLPGYPDTMRVTPEMLDNRDFVVTFMKNMAEAEAKSGSTVMNDQQWQQAFDMYQKIGTGQ